MISLDLQNTKIKKSFFDSAKLQKKIKLAHDALHSLDKSAGTGWVDLPSETTKAELQNIKAIAKEIQDKCDLFLVVGIGGSYAGANAGLAVLKKGKTEVKFVGTSFSAQELLSTLDDAKHREVCVCAISKSGNTTETAIAFSAVEEFMKKKYKKGEYKKRIYIITDYEMGGLRQIATNEGYSSFIIPRTIGGRYSIFSMVGLLPLAVGGVNIEKLMAGAALGEKNYSEATISLNPAYQYAAARYYLGSKSKKAVEVLASFDTRLVAYFEWQKQLFAESEGKDKKGLFVSSLIYSKDLHSFGQYIQQGAPIVFETIIDVVKESQDMELTCINKDGPFGFLSGKKISEVTRATLGGIREAHKAAGVPIISIVIDELTEECFGELLYFMMVACATSAYLIGVNPFDQPGVEVYKAQTRQLLN